MYEKEFVILSKRDGCKYCTQLKMFLTLGMDGKFDHKFETIYEDDALYHKIVEEHEIMAMPVIYNLKTQEYVTGFDATDVVRMLQ